MFFLSWTITWIDLSYIYYINYISLKTAWTFKIKQNEICLVMIYIYIYLYIVLYILFSCLIIYIVYIINYNLYCVYIIIINLSGFKLQLT